LNDTGKIENLNLGPVVHDLTRHSRERRELVRSGFGMLAGQLAHERTLAHRWKTDKAYTGNTSPSDIESDTCATASAAGRLEQLPLELSEFCLQLPYPRMSMLTCSFRSGSRTKMEGRRLVLLGLGHLRLV
jgi:hypothetical protein